MAEFEVAADGSSLGSLPHDTVPDTAGREPDSFHRWVNRRWPRREHPEIETAEA